MTKTSVVPKFIGKFTENFSSRPLVFICLGVFVFVSFIAFFTPLAKFMNLIVQLVLIVLLAENSLRTMINITKKK